MARTIVIFEKQPRWGPELQRQFLAEDVQIRACRAVRDLRPLLETDTQPLIVMDVEGAVAECLQFVGGAARWQPMPATILIGSRAAAELEWAFRELGVLEFAPEDLTGAALARLCRRQFRVAPAA